MLFKLAEIERNVGHGFRQYTARRAARQISFELLPVEHPAAMVFNQLARCRAGRHQLHARLLYPARNRIAAQTLRAVFALARKPVRALLDNLRNPVKRLHIIDEGRPVENTNLRHIRRAVPRQAALTFDGFNHCRLFTANISAGAAAQINCGEIGETSFFNFRNLFEQNFARRQKRQQTG